MAHNKRLGAKHHELIGQQSFLGASVVNFNLSLGFGSQPSRLRMNLVEDPQHDETPEGKIRFYNAIDEGYHPWKDTVMPFNLYEQVHTDNLGQMPPKPALAKGGDKYPPHTGGRLGLPVLIKLDHPTEGECDIDPDTNTNKTDCEAASGGVGVWTPAAKYAYTHGDKFFFLTSDPNIGIVGGVDTMLGSPVWFNWYRYDKVDAEDPGCLARECGKENDIVKRGLSKSHPWYFNGILSNAEVDHGTGSGRIISLTVEDPRAILAGTHVILGKFQDRTMPADGSVKIIESPYPKRLYKDGFIGYYNTLNVYGFLEDAYGFGETDKNEAGIIWYAEEGDNASSVRADSVGVDSAGATIGAVEDYKSPPGSNVLDVLQWMLMGSADAKHGDKDTVGWPTVREPGEGFFAGYRYHGPADKAESKPSEQRPIKPDGFRIGQERYGGLLYYVTNALFNEDDLVANHPDFVEQNVLYGPPNEASPTGFGTLSGNANRYKVDLSELKKLNTLRGGLLDDNFRIAADDLSLLDLIQLLCDYGSSDFFVELLPDIAPWPRGQREMVCRDGAGDRVDTLGDDPITTDGECQAATANAGTWTEEDIVPINGEGVTGVIKIRVIPRIETPSNGILERMISDSKFDPFHIDDGEDPDIGFNLEESEHFKLWRGRVQSSKIGYEFADLPTGKILMGAPRTRMVGVDPLGLDFIREDFGDCIDNQGEIVIFEPATTAVGSDFFKIPKSTCEEKFGDCYDKAHSNYITDGSCLDQGGLDPNDRPEAVYPPSGGTGTAGDVIRNEIDCNDTANLPAGGQWCAYVFEAGRKLTDFDGVEPPTNRTDIGETGFFDNTNLMQEDQFGRDILGNKSLYEKRDYRNDFWANAINDQPHLMRISGPDGKSDTRLDGWGNNGSAGDQAFLGLGVTLGGDPSVPSTSEVLVREPVYGDGTNDVLANPGDNFGGDGYADLYPAWGMYDRPEYCSLIIPESNALDDGARICNDIMGCTWTWDDPDDHSSGGLCKQTVPVKYLNVPKKGFFWDDEPQKDFNIPGPDTGYFSADKSDIDDSWTRFNPPAGLMSMYEWVEPGCDEDLYAFPACRGINSFKGQGYPTADQLANYTRPRLKKNNTCEKCTEHKNICEDQDGNEIISTGSCGMTSGDPINKEIECLDSACWPALGGVLSATWIGGGCKKWETVDPATEDLRDIDDCFCENDAEFVPAVPTVIGPTVATCEGTGNNKFDEVPTFTPDGRQEPNRIDRRAGFSTVGSEGILLPDSAIIEIDMSDVFKVSDATGNAVVELETPLYDKGEELTGLDHRKYIYLATVTELRAAASNKVAWLDYLAQWGVKLEKDMNWANNSVTAHFQTMYQSDGPIKLSPEKATPGVSGNLAAGIEMMFSGIKFRNIHTGSIVGKDKDNTSFFSLKDARSGETRTNAFKDPENVTVEIDLIFKKIQDIAQNWYGKAYLMPLPYDPEDIEEHVRSSSTGYTKEIESPKLELDWDIAQSAFVEMEFDRFRESWQLDYPLSANFTGDDGKMDGFFVFPQEYKGIKNVNSLQLANNPDPTAMKVNVNAVNKTDRFITVPKAPPLGGSNKNGKVFVKASIDSETYWLWEDDESVLEYIRENQNKPDFKLIDAFDKESNGECSGEGAVDDSDPLAPDSSAKKGQCENDDVNGFCTDPATGDRITTGLMATDQQACEAAGNDWGGGAGTWISKYTGLKLKPYALLKMNAPVTYDVGLTDREKAAAGRAAVGHIFDVLFDWPLKADLQSAFASLGVDFVKSALVSARFKPFGAAVPQVSNRHVWGPWALGQDFGKVEVEKDNNFEPANFGTIDAMNTSAISKIRADLVFQQITESGFVELTGGPEYFAGRPIGWDDDQSEFTRFLDYFQNGAFSSMQGITPYITDIGVDTNPSAGVTTKYTMRTWVPRLGKLEEWKLREGIRQTKELHKSNMEKNTRQHKEATRASAQKKQDIMLDLGTLILPIVPPGF